MVTTLYPTLGDLYTQSVKMFAKNECFSVYKQQSLTYAEFSTRVDQVVVLLKKSGLVAGDKVVVLGQNMPNWNAAYFAAVSLGMVAVPVLPDFSASEVNKIIAHSEAKAVVISEKQRSKLDAQTIASLNVVILADDLSVVSTKDGLVDIFQPIEVDSESVAVIIYTSGTTSSPKGVMLSHHNLCSQLQMVLGLQDVQVWDVFLSLLPLSHTYECTLGMLLPFMQGASVVYIDKAPTASVLLPVLKSVRPTIILSVPLIIEKIYKAQVLPKFTGTKFMNSLYSVPSIRKVLHRIAGKKLMDTFGGRVRFFGVGGSKIDPRVERFLLEAKFPYAIGYGLTETAPLIAGVNPSMAKLQSTGPQLKGVELRIDNPNPLTGEGEIVAKGPNIMMGYFKNAEATADAFTADGWFRTKDLGVFDSKGFLYIKGRLNNMILGASGENIYPEEIEHVINEHSLVLDSIVKEEKGRLIALVQFNREELEQKYHMVKEELEAKIESLKAELILYINSKVNRFSHVSLIVEQVTTFEKTPTQKIKRFLY